MANSITRFRAYQLGEKGSSFSYCVDNMFILIEARYNDINKNSIETEMKNCECSSIDKLHITSWDEDHCKPAELKNLLVDLLPSVIECPGYQPDTECGKESYKIIKEYGDKHTFVSVYSFTPSNINALPVAEERKYTEIVFNPLELREKHNDNSTVKLFRRGRFCVLSLGDCESVEIANTIANSAIARSETDVLILAHHGADNGFTTSEFIRKIKPKIAICTSNYDNPYEHPDQRVRTILVNENVPLYTTKTGDVIVVCGVDNNCIVYNLTGNNSAINSKRVFKPKLIINNQNEQ